MEFRAAVDAGDVLVAEKAGVVKEVSADAIEVMNDDGTYTTYKLLEVPPLQPGHLHQPAAAGQRG